MGALHELFHTPVVSSGLWGDTLLLRQTERKALVTVEGAGSLVFKGEWDASKHPHGEHGHWAETGAAGEKPKGGGKKTKLTRADLTGFAAALNEHPRVQRKLVADLLYDFQDRDAGQSVGAWARAVHEAVADGATDLFDEAASAKSYDIDPRKGESARDYYARLEAAGVTGLPTWDELAASMDAPYTVDDLSAKDLAEEEAVSEARAEAEAAVALGWATELLKHFGGEDAPAQHKALVTENDIRAGEAYDFVDPAPFGFCPECRAPGVGCERRPNGNAHCANGHVYERARAKYASTQVELTGAANRKLLALGLRAPKHLASDSPGPRVEPISRTSVGGVTQEPHQHSDAFPLGLRPAEARADVTATARQSQPRVIDPADLCEEAGGFEESPHVTCLYGLHVESPEVVASVVRGFGPVALTVGAIKAFRGSETGRDYDVLYAEVDSPDLHRLHSLLKTLPHTEKFSTYKPHATICYLKAGLADKYLATLEPVNESLTVSALTVCSAARAHTSVPLTAVAKSLPSLLAALADARGPDFAAAVLAEARVLKAHWEESKHNRDHGKFASKPGAKGDGADAKTKEKPEEDEPEEWDGTIDQDDVTDDESHMDLDTFDKWDEGDKTEYTVRLAFGTYTTPQGDDVDVFRWEAVDDDGDITDKGDWAEDKGDVMRDGKSHARSEHEDAPDPEDSDIDHPDGQSWSNRDVIGNYTNDNGDERTVRLEEGTFEFGGRDHNCYRWTTRHDEDGEWTLDRDAAVAEGEEYAEDNHVEPEEEDEDTDSVDLTQVDPPTPRDVTLGAERLAPSEASIRVSQGIDARTVNDIAHAVFGGTYGDLTPLMHSLGMPDDAALTVTSAGPYVKKYSDDPDIPGAVGVRVTVKHPKMNEVSRFVGVDGDGKRFIKNEIVEIKKEFQGEGMGEQIFAKQVESAANAGVDYIATHAAGRYGSSFNGYYTWPTFGYDMALDDAQVGDAAATFAKARQLFPDAKSVLDVMATPSVDLSPEEHAATKAKLESLDTKLKKPAKDYTTITGADWWKANGNDLYNAQFDLDPASRSMAVLAARRRKSKAATKSS